MRPIRWPLAGIFLLLAAQTAHAAAPADAMVAAFRDICAADDPRPAATLAHADRLGWRTKGTGAPPDFVPTTQRLAPAGGADMMLTTGQDESATEEVDSCGVSAPVPVGDLTGATQAWLGSAPIFAMGHSASFLALRVGSDLRPAAGAPPAEVRAAHDAGRLYSVMVLDDESGHGGKGRASLVLLRTQPNR